MPATDPPNVLAVGATGLFRANSCSASGYRKRAFCSAHMTRRAVGHRRQPGPHLGC
ncbi:MAG TPA: hypothetical protein VH092_22245 [Urbifossiella sp.]|nr:hypothetical protein [Urbifossiella sp.]